MGYASAMLATHAPLQHWQSQWHTIPKSSCDKTLAYRR